MIDWFIFLAYALTALFLWKPFAKAILEYTCEDSLKICKEDRFEAKFIGFILIVFWPIIITTYILSKIFFNGDLKTNQEIINEKEKELNRLRKLAKDHNLPGWE